MPVPKEAFRTLTSSRVFLRQARTADALAQAGGGEAAERGSRGTHGGAPRRGRRSGDADKVVVAAQHLQAQSDAGRTPGEGGNPEVLSPDHGEEMGAPL